MRSLTRHGVRVRPLSDDDWPAVARLEARVYAPLGLSEGEEALASRARASPETCYVVEVAESSEDAESRGSGESSGSGESAESAEDPQSAEDMARGANVAGYLVSLPYPPFRSPDLARTEATAFRSSNLHLHDLAVAPPYRGGGLARRLLERLTATARDARYERISLIAVAGSAPFWTAHGYHPHREVLLPASYGTDATYMSMAVPGRRRG